jgi:hypothetical protein
MSRPAPPSNLIYDSGMDNEGLLHGRLESRWRDVKPFHVIVRLKNGSTKVGRVCYFDTSRLTLSQEGRLCDFNYQDIAQIVASALRL